MSRLGFANIYELLDESDSSGVESGKKAQEALEKKNAAAAAALAPTPKPASTQGKPAGERRQGGNSESRGPRSDRPRGDRPPRAEGDRPRGPRPDRPQGERPPRTEGDRPPRAEGDRPRRPRPVSDSPQLEGGEANFNESGQAAAAGAPRTNLPRGQKGGPRGDRGYERRRTGDQDQRPKREYDRHSGTGRGKEVSKGGAGKGNWGSVEEEAQASIDGSAAEVAAAEDAKKEGEEGAVEVPATAETAAEAEPEEPPVRTLDDYLNQRKKVAVTGPAPRRAGEGEDSEAFKGYTQFAREEESLFSVDRSAKDKKAKETKEGSQKKVSADQVLRFQDKERRDNRDDRKGGRGGQQGRGQQRGGRTGGAAPSFDLSAFPSLSTKA